MYCVDGPEVVNLESYVHITHVLNPGLDYLIAVLCHRVSVSDFYSSCFSLVQLLKLRHF